MPFTRADVRHLLQDALDEGALDVLCSDYFPTVYRDFTSGQSFSARIQKLLDFVERTNLVEPLLAHVSEANPRRYAEWERPQREAELNDMIFHHTGRLIDAPDDPPDGGTFSDPERPLIERDWRAEIARWQQKLTKSQKAAAYFAATFGKDKISLGLFGPDALRIEEVKYTGNQANAHATLGQTQKALELYAQCIKIMQDAVKTKQDPKGIGADRFFGMRELAVVQWNMALAYARQWQWERAVASAQLVSVFFNNNKMFTAPPALPARLAEWKRTLGEP